MAAELYSSRLVALIYGLGLRISQARQVAEYSVIGKNYWDPGHYDLQSGVDWEWDLYKVYAVRAGRIRALIRELDKELQARSEEVQLLDERRKLRTVADACAKWQPSYHESWIEFGWSPYCFSSESKTAKELAGAVEERTQVLVNVLARHRDVPNLLRWFELGTLISDCPDERNTPKLEGPGYKPELWFGLDRLTFEELERFEPKNWGEKKIAKLLKQLGVRKADIVADVDRDDLVQREILEGSCQFIPAIFPGWFRPEVCFWRAIYEKTTWRRPGLERDRLFLQWELEMSADESRINVAIRDRWNELPENERRAIAPGCYGRVGRETVKKARKNAMQNKMSDHERLL